jgi:hypothetical protein
LRSPDFIGLLVGEPLGKLVVEVIPIVVYCLFIFLLSFFVHLIHFGLKFNLLSSKLLLEFSLLFLHKNSLMLRHTVVEN